MSKGVDRQPWRARTVEQAIEPALPMIDAHHHLWPEVPAPHLEKYPLESLIADKQTSGHNIRQTVFVEAMARYRAGGPASLRPVGETEFAEAMGRAAEQSGGAASGACAAIVAFADMMLGEAVEEVLHAHRQAAPERLRGIRTLVAYDPEFSHLGSRPGLLGEPQFRSAFARLKPNGLSFDVWIMHTQLAELAALADEFPETQIVLDHLGSPMRIGRFAGDAEAAFADWRAAMEMVASRPNVALKLGGLQMAQTRLGTPQDAAAPWTSDQLAQVQRRHVLTAIDLFGPGRCMFESNFPVDRLMVDASILWNTFKKLTRDFAVGDRQRLFFGTAAEIYRLSNGER